MAPVLGLFEFDLFGKTGFIYCLVVLFVMFLLARRIVHSPFGLSLRAIRNNPLRAAAIGIPVNRRLIAIYTIAAFYAGIAGGLSTQSTALASLDVFSFERSADLLLVLVIGGTGYLYGGLIGAVAFKLLQDVLATWTPQYWQFWIGLILVILVLIGRERLQRWIMWGPDRIKGMFDRRKGRVGRGRGRNPRDARARNPGTDQDVRRADRDARPVAEGRARRAPCADRSERRGQDHGDQPSDRRAAPQCRARPARRHGHHRAARRTGAR